MQKGYLTFFLMLFFLISNAQFKAGKIYLKDGNIKNGLIKERKFGGIKYKDNENSKAEPYDYNHITGYDITEKGVVKYRYKKVGNNFPQIMKVVRLGKINLYNIIVANREISTGIKVSTSLLYFMEKNTVTIRIGRKFNKNELNFFEDCPLLLKKIKKKEFKKKDVYKVVNFYNNNCT